ncbi:DUF3168 domain-containing protein [Spirosoma foliorum]|uniref:DUF3168 domain-containing protein n=1 Tax=Spirosoma foliorum TaxID=2710596 RepID=A0A7G5H2J1_9BACT|nr:DUF3168 domain-containing protein [Spirosoma foliorum]QMW05333.1 DUF3168 domain-containing protein [Spirosoma foliorum]
MNDASFALSVAYATLLAGLTYNGQEVKVYDQKASNTATFPYVILGPWQARSGNTKDSFGQVGEINLDIVTGFVGDQSSRKPSVEIGNLITSLLKPTPTAEVLTAPGFRVWMTAITATLDISDELNTKGLRRKIITVQHTLTEI